MTATIPALLQPLKDRLAAASDAELELVSTEPSMSGQHYSIRRKGAAGIRIQGHEYDHAAPYTRLLLHAPADQAKLIAAIEAVDSLASRTLNAPIEYSAGYLAKDIIAALTQALGGDTA